ncbi:hypothetical protein IFT59_07590 [Rhizobium sp. CFBP 8752]|uniref:hypothetical protein n=1 Tax=Rhizobium sp. CFBP 8752 TaxID=2775301 RepID=UPI001785CC66|nr:hypothetical protein [Rhizobium sp. CFBP 8752]MBD8663114.1 hypothetical protein [Rhizobium sp. CFBP 8752]
MRAKQQTAPVWDFLGTAFRTHDALKAGVLDPVNCGPWIEECEADGKERQFLLNWNDFDPDFCDGVEGLIEKIDQLIFDAIYDDEFRRCISGVFYRRVLSHLEGKFHCGDSVDRPVLVAWRAAEKASDSLNEMVEYAVQMTDFHKLAEGPVLAKMKRRCDRYIRLANKAYDAACDNCCQFGWEENIEKFIHRDEPYPKVAIFADYIQGNPQTLKSFYVRVDSEQRHFTTLEEARSFAFFHAETVWQSSSVDDYLEESRPVLRLTPNPAGFGVAA